MEKNKRSYEVFSRFDEVREKWEELLPQAHHLRNDDLLVLEKSNIDDIQYKYLNLYEDKECIGILYLQEFVFSQKHYNKRVFEKKYVRMFQCFIEGQNHNLLICGNLFRVNFQGFYFKNKTDEEKLFDFLSLYRMDHRRKKKFSGILVKDCSYGFSFSQSTIPSQYKPFQQDISMELHVSEEWKTFELYLQKLSRKYRQRATKILKDSAPVLLRDMSEQEIIFYQKQIYEMYLHIVRKQTITLGILNETYFIQMKYLLRENFCIYGYFLDNTLIGFASHIYYPEKQKMEIHYIGYSEEVNNTHSLYFAILFDGLKTAIHKNYRIVELGRTALEAKASLGAVPVEKYNYIWIRIGLARITFNFLSSWFLENIGATWKNRNPFKSSE